MDRLLLQSCSPSVPGLPDLLSGWPGTLAVLSPVFLLLLLLLAHLLVHLQDDAGELVEVAEVLNIRQLDAVHEVNLYCLLPCRNIGVTLWSEWVAVSRAQRLAETHSSLGPTSSQESSL